MSTASAASCLTWERSSVSVRCWYWRLLRTWLLGSGRLRLARLDANIGKSQARYGFSRLLRLVNGQVFARPQSYRTSVVRSGCRTSLLYVWPVNLNRRAIGSVYDHQGRSSLSHALRAASKSVSASGSRDAFMKVSHRLLITVRGHLGVPAFPALGRLLSWTLSASRVCCLEDRRPGILSSCAQQAHSRIPEHPVVVVAFATGQVKEYEHRYMSNKSVPAHATRPLRLVNSDFWRRQ